MTAALDYRLNAASWMEIAEHLLLCDARFVPPLSARVKIEDYARKLALKATRFEAWSSDRLTGLVAVYCNDQTHGAFITNVSVLPDWTDKGIASTLMRLCIAHSSALGMRQISLDVARNNAPAIGLYGACGFTEREADAVILTMNLDLASRPA